jgi:hypothetical protein
MKKLLLALLSLGLFASSCQKNDSIETPSAAAGKKVPVKISIADFLQKVENLPSPQGRAANYVTNRDSLQYKVSYLYCYIGDFDSRMKKFHYQDVLNSGSDFGTIKDSLVPEDYKVYLVASTLPLNYYTSYTFGFQRGTNPDGALVPCPDVFAQRLQFRVDSSGNVSTINTLLDRIVGKLEVNILDATVADSSLTVKMTSEDFNYNFISGLPEHGAIDYYSMYVNRQNPQTYSSLVLNTATEFTVTITYIDKNTHLTATKEVNHVRCYKNKKTTLTGRLYNTPQSGANRNFVIDVKDQWDIDGPSQNF